ncbi:MAG: DJ-1/PfpI family protein [Acidimicrobiales bacterium]|nr:DJ-1/PfpI family protein [Acidimicrobiales bacterium]
MSTEPAAGPPASIAIALYDGFTALDAMGPYAVLATHPGSTVTFVADRRGPIRDDQSLTVNVDTAFDDLPDPDMIVIPGGIITRRMARDGHPVVDWIRRVHPHTTWSTSVCTGAVLLAAAGVLDGLDATTHWIAYDQLAELGAHPTGERVVIRGKVATAAGVSSGIDLALTLVQRWSGDFVAQAIQLGIEYDPQPPLDAGSPTKAPAKVLEVVGRSMRAAEAASLA